MSKFDGLNEYDFSNSPFKDGEKVFKELLSTDKVKKVPRLTQLNSPNSPVEVDSDQRHPDSTTSQEQEALARKELFHGPNSKSTNATSDAYKSRDVDENGSTHSSTNKNNLTSLQITLQKLEEDKARHSQLVDQVNDTGRLVGRRNYSSTMRQLADSVPKGQEAGMIRKPFWQNVKEKPLVDGAKPASSSGENSSNMQYVDEDTIREFFEHYYQQKSRMGSLTKYSFGKMCTDSMRNIVHAIEAARIGDELFARYSDRGQMVEGGYYGAVAELAERIGGTVARGENIMFKALLLVEEGPEAMQQDSSVHKGSSSNVQNSSRDRENSSSGHISSTGGGLNQGNMHMHNAQRHHTSNTNNTNHSGQHQSLNSSPSASSLLAAGAESRGGSRNPSRRPSRDAAPAVPSPRNATTRGSQPVSRGSTQEYVQLFRFTILKLF